MAFKPDDKIIVHREGKDYQAEIGELLNSGGGDSGIIKLPDACPLPGDATATYTQVNSSYEINSAEKASITGSGIAIYVLASEKPKYESLKQGDILYVNDQEAIVDITEDSGPNFRIWITNTPVTRPAVGETFTLNIGGPVEPIGDPLDPDGLYSFPLNPQDGVVYGRKDCAWEEIPEGFSGNYNDLTNKPTIPTVYNGRLTVADKDGTTLGQFTANQSSSTNIEVLQEAPDDGEKYLRDGSAEGWEVLKFVPQNPPSSDACFIGKFVLAKGRGATTPNTFDTSLDQYEYINPNLEINKDSAIIKAMFPDGNYRHDNDDFRNTFYLTIEHQNGDSYEAHVSSIDDWGGTYLHFSILPFWTDNYNPALKSLRTLSSGKTVTITVTKTRPVVEMFNKTLPMGADYKENLDNSSNYLTSVPPGELGAFYKRQTGFTAYWLIFNLDDLRVPGPHKYAPYPTWHQFQIKLTRESDGKYVIYDTAGFGSDGGANKGELYSEQIWANNCAIIDCTNEKSGNIDITDFVRGDNVRLELIDLRSGPPTCEKDNEGDSTYYSFPPEPQDGLVYGRKGGLWVPVYADSDGETGGSGIHWHDIQGKPHCFPACTNCEVGVVEGEIEFYNGESASYPLGTIDLNQEWLETGGEEISVEKNSIEFVYDDRLKVIGTQFTVADGHDETIQTCTISAYGVTAKHTIVVQTEENVYAKPPAVATFVGCTPNADPIGGDGSSSAPVGINEVLREGSTADAGQRLKFKITESDVPYELPAKVDVIDLDGRFASRHGAMASFYQANEPFTVDTDDWDGVYQRALGYVSAIGTSFNGLYQSGSGKEFYVWSNFGLSGAYLSISPQEGTYEDEINFNIGTSGLEFTSPDLKIRHGSVTAKEFIGDGSQLTGTFTVGEGVKQVGNRIELDKEWLAEHIKQVVQKLVEK